MIEIDSLDNYNRTYKFAESVGIVLLHSGKTPFLISQELFRIFLKHVLISSTQWYAMPFASAFDFIPCHVNCKLSFPLFGFWRTAKRCSLKACIRFITVLCAYRPKRFIIHICACSSKRTILLFGCKCQRRSAINNPAMVCLFNAETGIFFPSDDEMG